MYQMFSFSFVMFGLQITKQTSNLCLQFRLEDLYVIYITEPIVRLQKLLRDD